jgi:hypothetical protein
MKISLSPVRYHAGKSSRSRLLRSWTRGRSLGVSVRVVYQVCHGLPESESGTPRLDLVRIDGSSKEIRSAHLTIETDNTQSDFTTFV